MSKATKLAAQKRRERAIRRKRILVAAGASAAALILAFLIFALPRLLKPAGTGAAGDGISAPEASEPGSREPDMSRVGILKDYVFADPEIAGAVEEGLRARSVRDGFYVVFLSICDAAERARVFTGTGGSLAEAWGASEEAAARFVEDNDFVTVWAKADLVDSMERAPAAKLNDYVVSSVYQNFFRKGIALDDRFDVAFLEAEISGNKLLTYYSERDVADGNIDYGANLLHMQNINFYLDRWRGLPEIGEPPDEIVIFTTMGYFCDEGGRVFDLYNGGMDTGRRKATADATYLEPLVLSASNYLYGLIEPDGKFVYGYYPVFDNWMTGYNIVRHAGSIWSLINLYRMTGDAGLVGGIDSAMAYMVGCIDYQDAETAYLVEFKADEIKLGANGLAIVAMTEYMDVFGSDRYVEQVGHLANGILALQDPGGGYYHVLNYPDFSRKEAYRTVYYDGEATFALARAFTFTGDGRYLEAAARAVDYFIENNYARYRDHWVAYSLHEVTKYLPEDRYFRFAMENVTRNIDRIFNQTTSYHTYLELLAISWQTYLRAREAGFDFGSVEGFDETYFAQALYRRAAYMLNSYFFPEYAMYMKVPADALGTFFVRHDSFRVRIDDIQHFIGGYYYFLRNYDSIRPLLSDEFVAVTNGGAGWADAGEAAGGAGSAGAMGGAEAGEDVD